MRVRLLLLRQQLGCWWSSGISTAFLDFAAAANAKLTYTAGTANADTIVANVGSTLTGGAGADTLTGGAGVDTITGAGKDHIDVSSGADTLTGGADECL